MNYLIVAVLLLIVFTFLSDRKIRSIDDVKLQKLDIYDEISIVERKMNIIYFQFNKSKKEQVKELLKQLDKYNNENIILQDNRLVLDDHQLKTIIANYILTEEKTCGFNIQYEYKTSKKQLKRLVNKMYVLGINYIDVFDKQTIFSYGVVIIKREKLLNILYAFDMHQKYKVRNLKKKIIVSFLPSYLTKYNMNENDKKLKITIKQIYIDKITSSNILLVLKTLLLSIAGWGVAANVILAALNINDGIYPLIIAIVTYYCYTYIFKYIYKTMGKYRVIVSYLFPIYIILYIILTVYTFLNKGINSAQAS